MEGTGYGTEDWQDGNGDACPNPLHAGSVLVAKGTRTGKTGMRQRFECRPIGYDKHQFSVLVTATDTPMPLHSPPPACVQHPESQVIRIGTYGRGAVKQRYRCTRADGSSHDFTPELPRGHVHIGADQCVVCGELRGVHHGERSAARQSSWSAHDVASVLTAVASGASYGKASRDARARTGRDTRRPGGQKVRKPGERVSQGQLESRRFWHTAADFVEVYGPVLWAFEEEQLRLRDKQMMEEAISIPARPTVLVLDALPVFGKRTRNASKREWVVLAAAQVVYREESGATHKSTRLRLVRAFPTGDVIAWKVFLSELSPFEPQFVVSDYDSAQMKAIGQLWPNATLIPSLYQMRTNIEEAMLAAPHAWVLKEKVKQPVPTLRAHLKLLRATNLAKMNAKRWTQWWDSVLVEMHRLGAPVDRIMAQRGNYEAHYLEIINVFKQHPDITLSTGGLEVLLADKIKPLLQRRKHGFANIERTNSLFDLVVCRDAGLFHDQAQVLQLLRADNEDYYGWSMEPRVVADVHPIAPNAPQKALAVRGSTKRQRRVRYSSLRDAAMLRAVAEKKGLLA